MGVIPSGGHRSGRVEKPAVYLPGAPSLTASFAVKGGNRNIPHDSIPVVCFEGCDPREASAGHGVRGGWLRCMNVPPDPRVALRPHNQNAACNHRTDAGDLGIAHSQINARVDANEFD